MDWTAALAKRDFQHGHLLGFVIVPALMAEGWSLRLRSAVGVGFLVDAHDKRPRVFKTLDAAVRELQRIGFAVPGLEVCSGL